MSLSQNVSYPAVAHVWADLEAVRAQSPLVHSITNYVVMNNTANALLALGASPIMAHAVEEMPDMVGIIHTLVINIGTLSPHWVEGMHAAMQTARRLGKPIVLDPVGAGATPYRTSTCQALCERYRPHIIRGNASEIRALANAGGTTKGVDSTDASEAALEAARALCERYGSVVVISGEVDYIVEEGQGGMRVGAVNNGHPLMTRITGMGCTASVVTGAFAAVQPDLFRACQSAMAVMGVAGELAYAASQGPGSMQVAFLDALYNLSEKQLSDLIRCA